MLRGFSSGALRPFGYPILRLNSAKGCRRRLLVGWVAWKTWVSYSPDEVKPYVKASEPHLPTHSRHLKNLAGSISPYRHSVPSLRGSYWNSCRP